MEVKFNDLVKQWDQIKDKVNPKIQEFFNSSAYICGPYLQEFENNFSKWSGRKYSIGVSNGTDGLKMAIQALNLYEGTTDVVMPANTFIADPLAVYYQVKGDFNVSLIDHDNYFQMDLDLLVEHLDNTRDNYDHCIILPVHLYGHPTDMLKVSEIAKKYNCKIIEDASQSHGAITNGEMIGKYADMTVYSLYPGKNLGAIGDAGIITTDSDDYKDRLCSLRNYGSSKKYYYDDIGWNHRMDPLQAIILGEKLVHLDSWNRSKQEIVKKYNELLCDDFIANFVQTPKEDDHVGLHVYHIYCLLVDRREELQQFLDEKGIQTGIHYPVPIQKTKPFEYLDIYNNPKTIENSDKIFSLPMHPWLTDNEIEYTCDCIKQFYTV